MRTTFLFAAILCLSAAVAPAQTPAPSPAPAPDSPASRQLREGREVIVAAYAPLAQKFNQVHGTMVEAGGVSCAGLTSREAIAARKALIDACLAVNTDMLKFLATEPAILRAELLKVPMPPAQVAEYVANFTPDPETPQIVKVRTLAQAMFKSMNASLTVLDESFGRWKVGDGNHLSFQRESDFKKYGATVETVNQAIDAETEAVEALKANGLEKAAPAPR